MSGTGSRKQQLVARVCADKNNLNNQKVNTVFVPRVNVMKEPTHQIIWAARGARRWYKGSEQARK